MALCSVGWSSRKVTSNPPGARWESQCSGSLTLRLNQQRLDLGLWESAVCFLHGALLWPVLFSSVVGGWAAMRSRVGWAPTSSGSEMHSCQFPTGVCWSKGGLRLGWMEEALIPSNVLVSPGVLGQAPQPLCLSVPTCRMSLSPATSQKVIMRSRKTVHIEHSGHNAQHVTNT